MNDRESVLNSVNPQRGRWIAVEPIQLFPIKIGRLLSLIGAAILFTVFLLREDLGEHEKDLLTQIQAGQARYGEDEGNNLLQRSIRNAKLDPDASSAGDTPLEKGTVGEATPRIEWSLAVLEEQQEEYEAAKRLRYALPADPVIEHQEGSIEALVKKAPSVLLRMSAVPHFPDEKQLTQADLEEVRALQALAVDMANAVPAYGLKVVENANAVEKRREDLRSFFNVLGWVLYPVGWLLTFGGALLEPEKQEKESLSEL